MKVLPITIYLNQRAVFDLLATIEDGFSEVRKVESSREAANKSEVNGELGVSNAFGLLGVKLGTALGKAKESKEHHLEVEEKIHTPSSLFAKLHSYLSEKGMVAELANSGLGESCPGSFVSFRGTLKRNPIISMLDSIEQFGVMAVRFKINSGAKGKPKGKDDQVLKEIKTMKDSLQQGDTLDLICELSANPGVQAVLPVYLDFFVNRNINEIVDGEYTVFGKVVKSISHDESFSLMRNTGFKLFDENALCRVFLTICMRQCLKD